MTLIEAVVNLPLSVTFAVLTRYYHRHEAHPTTTVDLSLGDGDRGTPIRVLLAGAGLAEGYGVRTQYTALTGQLGMALASRTGRGVIVASRTKPSLQLRDFTDFVGPQAAKGQDVVVFAPSLLEMTRGSSMRWHTELFRMVEFLHSTGGPGLRVVLTGFPVPRKEGLLELIARRGVRAANAAMRDVARSIEGTVYAETPSYFTLRPSGGSFDERYYVRCAEMMVEVLAPQLIGR